MSLAPPPPPSPSPPRTLLATLQTYAFQNLGRRARVVDVCDGDTLRVAAEVGGTGPYLLRVRLRDINTCELRSANPAARARALLARDRVAALLLGQACPPAPLSAAAVRAALEAHPAYVDLERVGADKYGRVLADARPVDAAGAAGASLAATLLREGLGAPYHEADLWPARAL